MIPKIMKQFVEQILRAHDDALNYESFLNHRNNVNVDFMFPILEIFVTSRVLPFPEGF